MGRLDSTPTNVTSFSYMQLLGVRACDLWVGWVRSDTHIYNANKRQASGIRQLNNCVTIKKDKHCYIFEEKRACKAVNKKRLVLVRREYDLVRQPG